MTAWLPPRLTPLDHNGPTNVPHDPLPPDWILRPVVDIFEGNAFAQPRADAVIDPATTLTYTRFLPPSAAWPDTSTRELHPMA
jgi:hypothetical protein